MPVSGKEESGVVAWQSSNCSAGVPIKKRKFPIFTPPSPPHQEQPSLGAENDLPQKEHSNRSQESSLSDVSVATNSSGLSGVNNNSFPVEREEGPAGTIVNAVGNNAAFTRIKLEEPVFATCSGSVDSMDSKVKFLMPERSVCQKVSENTKLYLAPNEALAPINVMGIANKQQFEADLKPELSTDSVKADLSLRLKEPAIVPLAAQNSKHSSQIQEKLDPSFSLTVGRGEPSKKRNSNEFKSDDHTACLSTDRSNWDLNTTMDAWEGSVGLGDAAASLRAVFDGLHVSGDTVDLKPSMSSDRMLRVAADTDKQIGCMAEQNTDFPLSSLCSEQQKSEDSLYLRLSMSSHLEQSSGSSSGKLVSSSQIPSSNRPAVLTSLVSRSQIPSSNVPAVLVSFESMDSVASRNIKKESFSENAKQDLAESRGNPIGSLDPGTEKGEMAERCNLDALKLSTTSPPKLVEHRPIKPEPAEDNQEMQRKIETSHQADGKVVQCERNFSSVTTVPLNSQKPCTVSSPKFSTELSTDVNTSNLAESSNNTIEVPINNVSPIEQCDAIDRVNSEMVVSSVNHENVGLNASDRMIETSAAKNSNVENSETSGIKSMAEIPPDSRGNGEGSVSSDEKLNILTDELEEVSYSSDYESDDNHAAVNPGDTDVRHLREDDEYEDGELREPLLQTASEGPILEVRETENVNNSECDIKHVDSGAPGDCIFTESGAVEKTNEHEDHGQASDDQIKECVDAVLNERADQAVGEDDSLQESLTVKMSGTVSNDKKPVKTPRRKLINLSGGKNVQKTTETSLSCVGATDSSQGPVTVGPAADKNIKETGNPEESDSTLPRTDPSVNCDDPIKDANSGAKRGVIINLPRATNVSPIKTRSTPGRPLASRSERERYNDFEGEKFHPRGHRDEIYIGGPRKFMRDRMEEQSHRNSRLNFMRGRGRVSSRLDGPRGDWDSNNDFSPEIYNGPTEHRFSRHKRPATADEDVELDCSGYIVGGRKPLDDELPSFRHSSSRRRSPGGSEGLGARGVHIVHRLPRSISPTRCISGDGSENFGLRPGEKLMRGLQDGIVDPIFTRPQPPYNAVDRQFVRGNRNFYSVQRRGLPRIQSKSPIRSRSRSPGPLSSSRRRSPDGFNGLPELTHRRSPPIYRMERLRSSGRPCFPEDIMPRRQGSPPYMSRSNELREMESGRDHGHLRPVMSAGRSPSERGLPRSTRRFDIIDPRERGNNDEYFGGPMHSGRFHKMGDDGNGDERRKCGERRPPIRSFRPPYNSGSRADPEFLERSNLREREFDGRIKNRSVNASRRTRSIEELEGNYRHGGQVWHDDGFDGVSRVKRKRFGH
ncbi:hypothetical protein NMG60_11018571 [Bertholletia excelsa]